MNCPYCNKELLEGYIPTQVLEWVPQNGEPKLKYTGNKDDGFRIGKHSFFDAKHQKAFYCSSCKKNNNRRINHTKGAISLQVS